MVLARREQNRWAKRGEAEAEGNLEPRHGARMVCGSVQRIEDRNPGLPRGLLADAHGIAWLLMYCPRCGSENDESNRFCVNCGSELAGERTTPSSGNPKERLRQLIGTTRQARLVTGGIVIALLIAVVAFLSLDSDGSESASSPYLASLDHVCVAEKERISALEEEALGGQTANPLEFASVLVTALSEWRENLRQTPPPVADREEAETLEVALLATLLEAAKLSRLVRAGGTGEAIDNQARAVDESTADLDETFESAGLANCARLQVSPASTQP
jgi:ribosomal protein S27AE